MNNPARNDALFHHPTLKDADDGTLYCFLNAERACNPECMAWQQKPDADEYRDQQWANCMLLVNAHRGGKHLVILASQGGELLKHVKNSAADAKRSTTPPKVG